MDRGTLERLKTRWLADTWLQRLATSLSFPNTRNLWKSMH
jgi:hypothetical protein